MVDHPRETRNPEEFRCVLFNVVVCLVMWSFASVLMLFFFGMNLDTKVMRACLGTSA